MGEIQHEIERLKASARKTELTTWLNGALLERFGPRLLPLDTQTLLTWGAFIARMEKSGRPLGAIAGLIAASALQHNLILVTRNVSDFQACGIQLLNPWD